jgi:hypothetical protein
MDEAGLLKALEFALNSYEYIWYATLISISGAGAWLVKRRAQRKMERFLHRKPEDHELISISSWIRAMQTEGEATTIGGRNKAD